MQKRPENHGFEDNAIEYCGAEAAWAKKPADYGLDPDVAEFIRAIARSSARRDHAKVAAPDEKGRPNDDEDSPPRGDIRPLLH